MTRLIITRGLPGSGKSTWARKYVMESPETRIIVNRDSIRHMLGKYWVQDRESLVSELERQSIYTALYNGYDVIVDATNFNNQIYHYYKKIRSILNHEKEYEIIVRDFTNIPIEECIRRDSLRQSPVGELVIKNMAYKYLKK